MSQFIIWLKSFCEVRWSRTLDEKITNTQIIHFEQDSVRAFALMQKSGRCARLPAHLYMASPTSYYVD
jgi:hypothetical protein